jgi:hypothetical protein
MEGFGFASVLTMVFAGQIYLRYKEPDLPRAIKVSPWYKFNQYGGIHFCMNLMSTFRVWH